MAPLRTIAVDRYVTPLREGGSLPAVVEADDSGMYVLKFRGAGQGPRALVAELVGGEIARILGLPVPEIVFAQLDPDLARTEPDPEIQSLIRASAGLNLALDYLPGSFVFDPAATEVDGDLASRLVWFDAFVSNVDRTAKNTNLLIWHRKLWLIDHGAALYFHHAWDGDVAAAQNPFAMIRQHVLLSRADKIEAVDAALAARLDRGTFEALLAQVPAEWLAGDDGAVDPEQRRAAYVEYFVARVEHRRRFVEEALRARG